MALRDQINKKLNTAKNLAQVGAFGTQNQILSKLLDGSLKQSETRAKNETGIQNPYGISTPTGEVAFDNYNNTAPKSVAPQIPAYTPEPMVQEQQSFQPDLNMFDLSGESYTNPTASELIYTMNKIGTAYQDQPDMDLYQLRQKLAYEQGLANVGLLPGQMSSQLEAIKQATGNEPVFNYDQLMRLNDSFAANYDTDINLIDDILKARKETGGAGSGMSYTDITASVGDSIPGLSASKINSIIQLAGTGGTSDERNTRRQQIAQALQLGGTEAFINELQMAGKQKMSSTEQVSYDKISGNVDFLNTAIGYMEDYSGNLGNVEAIRKNIEKTFGKGDKAYAAITFLTETPSAAERKEIFGASLTGSEQAAAERFVINPKDTKEVAIQKAKQMMVAMQMAQEIRPLQKFMSEGDIAQLKNYGVIRSYADRLIDAGLPVPDNLYPRNVEAEDGKIYRQIGKDQFLDLTKVGSDTKKTATQSRTPITGIDDAMRRIARNESDGSGGYKAIGPVVTSGMYKGQRALGKYQVMPGNIPQWSKEVLGQSITPQQFYASPELQERIVRGKMLQMYNQYGNWSDVASVWFTGKPLAQGANKRDVLGTTGLEYVRKFNS